MPRVTRARTAAAASTSPARFRPTMVLVSRIGWEQHKWEYNNPGYPFNLASIGISPSLISQLPVQSFPSIGMTGYTGFGPGRNIGDEFNVSSTWSWNEVVDQNHRQTLRQGRRHLLGHAE